MTDYNLLNRAFTKRALLAFLLVLPLFFGARPAQAQASYPSYVVEYGDTLSWIAQRFDTTLEELMALNNIQPDNVLRPGTNCSSRACRACGEF